jgi:hypothetical protein
MASIVILSLQSFVAKAQCPVGFLAYGVDETVYQLCDGAVVVNISAVLPPFVFIRETLGAIEIERDTVSVLTHTWPNMCQGTYLVFVDDTLGEIAARGRHVQVAQPMVTTPLLEDPVAPRHLDIAIMAFF